MSESTHQERVDDAAIKVSIMITWLSDELILGKQNSEIKKQAHVRFDRMADSGILTLKEAATDAIPIIKQALHHLDLVCAAVGDQYILGEIKKIRQAAD